MTRTGKHNEARGGNSAARESALTGRGVPMTRSTLPRVPVATAAVHYSTLREAGIRARAWLREHGASSTVLRAIRADGVIVEARVSLRATTTLRRLAIVG